MNDPIVGTVGHDCGRLVLHIEHHVRRSPGQVWRALGLTAPDSDATNVRWNGMDPRLVEWIAGIETVRWEVSAADDGTRLAVTTWIDGDDVEVAAATDADRHARFERLIWLLDNGAPAPPFRCAYFSQLATRYRAAVAAVLADTD